MNVTDCDPNLVLNWTDVDTAGNALYFTSEKIIIGIAMPCVLGIGVIANLAFLFVVFQVSYMRTTTNFYLANLAVADICFISLAVLEKMFAFSASPVSGDSAYSSSAGCICYAMTVYTTYFASIGLVTLVSLERYFALCAPVKHRRFSVKSRTVKLVIITWVISMVIAACVTLGLSKLISHCVLWPDDDQFEELDLPDTIEFCEPINDKMMYNEYIQIVAFPLALIGNTVMYWRIIRSLSSRVSSTTPSSSDHNRQARNQVAWMLIINGLVFFICHLPFNVLNILELVSLFTGSTFFEPNEIRIFVWVGRLTTFINSAANPFIYTTMSARYRQAYCEAFKCKCRGCNSRVSSCCIKQQNAEIFTTMNGMKGNYQDKTESSL